MEEMLNKIRGIYGANKEIIDRIESLEEVQQYEYFILKPSEFKLDVGEIVHASKVSDIIQDSPIVVTLDTSIKDLFNDKIDWTVKGWDDLKRLNEAMFHVCEKFEFFGTINDKTREELTKYLRNFEKIQVSLGSIEEKTLSGASRLASLKAEAEKLNQKVEKHLQKFMEETGLDVTPRNFSGGDLLGTHDVAQLESWFGTGWRLQYKASRDGWDPAVYHRLCDDRGPSVTVIKSINDAVETNHVNKASSSTAATLLSSSDSEESDSDEPAVKQYVGFRALYKPDVERTPRWVLSSSSSSESDSSDSEVDRKETPKAPRTSSSAQETPINSASVSTNSYCLFGGFLPVSLESSSPHYFYHSKMCLFTLRNPLGVAPTRFPIRCDEPQKARFFRFSKNGPQFGESMSLPMHKQSQEGSFGKGIRFDQDSFNRLKHTTKVFTGDTKFKAADVEVYIKC